MQKFHAGTALALFALALATPCGVVRAQAADAPSDRDQDARQLFQAAQVLYTDGDFERAGQMFESAYELSGRTQMLYNAYLAYRDGQMHADAQRVLGQYLDQPDAQNRHQLEARLAALQRAAEESERSGASEETRAESVASSDDPGDSGEVPATATPEEAASDTDVTHELEGTSGRSAVGPVVVGAGAALLIVGGVMGIMATKDANTLAERCVGTLCSPDDIGLRDQSRRRGNASTALLVGGGLTAALGAVLWALRGRAADTEGDASASVRPRVDVGCNGHSCAALVRGNF